MYTGFLKSTHSQFCFLCLIDKDAFRSADLAELSSGHQFGTNVFGSLPYARDELQNGNAVTSPGYKNGKKK